jgi:hypothetical protein
MLGVGVAADRRVFSLCLLSTFHYITITAPQVASNTDQTAVLSNSTHSKPSENTFSD